MYGDEGDYSTPRGRAPRVYEAGDGIELARFLRDKPGDAPGGNWNQVTGKAFRGHRFIDIRSHFRLPDGTERGTAKGVTIRASEIDKFIEAMLRARQWVHTGIDPNAKPGGAAPN